MGKKKAIKIRYDKELAKTMQEGRRSAAVRNRENYVSAKIVSGIVK